MTSLAPLRHRPFRWLFLGRTISSLGSGVAPIALGFAVLDLTGSLAALGLVVAARSVANVAALLFGGVAADRWPRHRVLTGAQSLAAVAQGAMAVLVLTGNATVPLLAALGMVNGAAAGLGFPATSAMVPLTVPSDVLRQANALSRLGATTALIGGAATGGSLVALAGPGWGLAADAVSFAVAAVCFARIGVASVRARASDSANSVLHDLREGWQEFRSRRWVVAVVAQYFVVNACLQGAIIVLGPAVADATFGRVGWGLALAALNLGLLVGGVLALRWQPAHALRWGVALCLATVLPVAALAGRAPLPLVAAALLLAGVAIEQFSVAWDVSLQQHVPPDRLARVYSYDALGSFAAIPVGEAATGMLAQAHGTEAVLVACAMLIAAATLAALTSTSIRTLEVRRPKELVV